MMLMNILVLEVHSVFIKTILPIKVNFLSCHCCKHFSKSFILVLNLTKKSFFLSVLKIIPRHFASSELHMYFLCFKYSIDLSFIEPIPRT